MRNVVLAASVATCAWVVAGSRSAGAGGPPAGAERAEGAARAERTERTDSHPVLVELFTSQGCSSCPAADAFVRELPRLGFGRDRVVPLTFHVDYWDGLGWKDPFAAAEFTRRQRDYSTSGRLVSPGGEDGISGLYTPQMIVGGHVHFSGRRRETALAEIARAAARAEPATLAARARLAKDTAVVSASLLPAPAAAATEVRPGPPAAAQEGRAGRHGSDWRLYVAVALKGARTAVAHGENGGETLEEAAIVRWLSPPIPIATTGGPVELEVPRPPGTAWKDLDLVAFVQAQGTREIVSVRTVATSPSAP